MMRQFFVKISTPVLIHAVLAVEVVVVETPFEKKSTAVCEQKGKLIIGNVIVHTNLLLDLA